MRKPEYLSPSSLKIFYSDRSQYYRQYLATIPSARFPQTQSMSVGSSFDAYVKSFLHKRLINNGDPQFEFPALFEAQVEPHNRDWALEAGKHCFARYMKLGALSDIVLDLQKTVGPPRFESDLKGFVSSTVGTVPFRGKPDIFFITEQGARVIFDWKVNGYCSNASPKPGYRRIRTDGKGNGDFHREARLSLHNGIMISHSHPMEKVEEDWATQTAIYAWLLGEDVGSQFISAIDQLACKGNDPCATEVAIRVAQHRAVISLEFQQKVFQKALDAWNAIQSGYIFFDTMSREDSDKEIAYMDMALETPLPDDYLEMFR